MEIRCYSDFSDLPLDSAEWRCLTRGVPFRSKEWLKSWWDHYGSGSLYLLSAIHENGSLIGLLPLRQQQGAAEGRCLRWLADGDVCTDYLTPLVGADYEADVCQAFADWLIENQSGRFAWDSLRLEGVAVGDKTLSRFINGLREHGAQVHQKPGLRCWRIELPDSWDDYLAQMSKSHRKQIRRVERRVLDEAATRVVAVSTVRLIAAFLRSSAMSA